MKFYVKHGHLSVFFLPFNCLLNLRIMDVNPFVNDLQISDISVVSGVRPIGKAVDNRISGRSCSGVYIRERDALLRKLYSFGGSLCVRIWKHRLFLQVLPSGYR